MKMCWEVDMGGNIIEHYALNEDEISVMREEGKTMVDFPWSTPIITPKFDFKLNDWVEGAEPSVVEQIKQESSLQQEIDELIGYLNETDFYYIRAMDSGKPVPQDVKDKRNSIRTRLMELGL